MCVCVHVPELFYKTLHTNSCVTVGCSEWYFVAIIRPPCMCCVLISQHISL